jgi:hypothetical protein
LPELPFEPAQEVSASAIASDVEMQNSRRITLFAG